ncbi:MAG TPA: glycosyltransferase [Solirubrobacteraceae bacterium]|nr:glycosyltransferase [Solirubrobacteraceae bacterium]
MRILVFHGYLLDGTGSNVYNARLAAALVELGHDVHMLCQDRHPERHEFVGAAGDWDGGELRVRSIERSAWVSASGDGGGIVVEEDASAPAREPRPLDGSCTVYRPNIGGLLPVYVADRYEGVEAKTFARCSDQEVARYIDANVAAVSDLCALVEPEIALANHLVMGPVILARGLDGLVPYAVKVHGSALEYTVKPEPERFLGLAAEGLAAAEAILVGSRHTADSLWSALGDPTLERRTRLGPPGVDVALFAPKESVHARARIRSLARQLHDTAVAAVESARADTEAKDAGAEANDAFARDDSAAASAMARIDLDHDRLVAFVGKLIVSKGIDLLLAAWPLVLAEAPDARLLVVGFGAYREACEHLIAALADGDLDGALAIARAGRALESAAPGQPLESATPDRALESGGTGKPVAPDQSEAPGQPLRHLLAFFEGLREAERERYLAAAETLPERVILTGRLDHDELAEVLPACEAMVVPSTFPEAFGMVAAEAAACGALPISAAHSGLAEVSEALARAVPAQAARWLSFPVDDSAVEAIAERVVAWLSADPELREETRAGLVATVRERWSWQGVARGVVAAARGELDRLAGP